jgi:poly-gamma-glutamate capsule biosynthesis protein CapA/YwtB (metallophosphatase superfamily)
MNSGGTGNHQEITIGLMGDVMIGRLVNEMLNDQPPAYIWGDTLSLLQNNNLNIINLEAALTHSTRKVPKVFNFKAQPAHIQSLAAANIGIVNIANNHILDFAEEGLIETVQTLTQANILYVGAGRNAEEASKPVILNIQGIRIGILGCTDNEPSWEASPQHSGTRFVEVEDLNDPRNKALIADITALRSKVDVLVLSIHWGPNMRERPTSSFRAFAHKMIESGVDILQGHSAHIFQGIEVYREKLILYDTGDYIDDYYDGPILRNDRSFLFLVKLSRSGLIELRLIPTLISNCQVNLAHDADAEASCCRMQSLSKELHTSIEKENNELFYRFSF